MRRRLAGAATCRRKLVGRRTAWFVMNSDPFGHVRSGRRNDPVIVSLKTC
jgi:hypothetical protein